MSYCRNYPYHQEKGETWKRCLLISETWHCPATWNSPPRLCLAAHWRRARVCCVAQECKSKHRHYRISNMTARNILKVIKVKYHFQLSLYARLCWAQGLPRAKWGKWIIHCSAYSSCRRCQVFYWWILTWSLLCCLPQSPSRIVYVWDLVAAAKADSKAHIHFSISPASAPLIIIL